MKIDEMYEEVIIKEKEVKVGETTIKVKQYLPLKEKFTLILNIIEGSYSKEGYKGLLSYLSYNINMIDFYTNLDFETDLSYFDLMDYLEENNIVGKVLNAIPETEKDFIQKVLLEDLEERKKKEDSLIGNLGKLFGDLAEEINSLDDEVLDRARKILSSSLPE